MGITRRALLTGAIGSGAGVVGVGALIEDDVLPGRVWLHENLHLNGPAGAIPSDAPDPVERGKLDGAHWWIARPPGATETLPVVLALHGAFSSADRWLEELSLDRFLAASGAKFALAGIDGGEHGYWHPRSDGRDPRALVIDRFLPLLSRQGLKVEAPGLIGWSMGGYGALLLATELGQVGPVVATSPAVWDAYAASAPGAFDSAADFDRWRILGDASRLAKLRKLKIRIDCGRGDPFLPGVRELQDDLPGAEVHLSAGAHNEEYWTRVLPDQLDWLGTRLG